MLHNLNFNLFLIRHGQTEVNARGNEVGQTRESPLTELGKKQAQALRARFDKDGIKFDRVFSSNYIRAYETARLALPKYLVYQYEELREYNAGDWLGGKREDIFIEAIELRMERLNNTFQPPNGESMNQVERRASKWLEDEILYNKALIQPDMDIPLNIAVFSHGMTIKCLLHYIMGFDKNFTWKINIDNTSVTKLSFNHRGWFLNSINDCSHL